MKDFRFRNVWVWFDAKQPCFELVCSFKVFQVKLGFYMNLGFL